MVRPSGEVRFVQASVETVFDEADKTLRKFGTLLDITARKLLERRLARQASHDPLTGLPNRSHFVDVLERALYRANAPEDKVAVLFVDLDDFKIINDSLGYEAGNRLLVAVAERMVTCLGPNDTAARLGGDGLGGDEFAVMLEGVADSGAAERVAARVAEALSRAPFVLGSDEVFVDCSIGIALGARGQERPQDLLGKADMAMHEAKSKGPYALYEARMAVRVRERLDLQNQLRRACERGEFEVR